MYKSIELASIIGSVYSEGKPLQHFSIENFINVITELRNKDRFIRVENFKKSCVHIEEISYYKCEICDDEIIIPDDPEIRDVFEREFYRLDLESRILLSQIVKNVFLI